MRKCRLTSLSLRRGIVEKEIESVLGKLEGWMYGENERWLRSQTGRLCSKVHDHFTKVRMDRKHATSLMD